MNSVEDALGIDRSPAALLGLGWNDAALQNILKEWPDRPFIDDESVEKAVEDGRLSLFNLDLGVYLSLTDERSFMSRYGLTRSSGAITVCRVVLFGQFRQDVNRYEGAVFAGLDTRSSFQAWSEALGRSEWVHTVAGVVRKARWRPSGIVVDVSFTPVGECRLISITPAFTQDAIATQSARREVHAQILSPEGVISSLGAPLTSPDLMRSMQGVGYPSKLDEASSYGGIDFSSDQGFELYAAPRHALNFPTSENIPPATLCLSGARYRHDLDFKSVQWQGALPFGITFDDGPDTVLAKIGQPVESEDFDEMEGFHRWRFESFDLHILYSLAEDCVYRVTLLGRKKLGRQSAVRLKPAR